MELADFINEHKNKLLNIAVILIALLIAHNIHKGQVRSVAALKEKKETELKKNEILGNISQLEKRLNLYKNLLNKKDISLIINTLNKIAKDAEVKINSIKPQAERAYPVYLKYPFDLTVEAESYHSLGRFISKLESHPHIYLVEQATIRKAAAGAQAGDVVTKLIADLKLTTIAFRD